VAFAGVSSVPTRMRIRVEDTLMDTTQKIHIGILSPATADRPHFKSLEQMLPPEIIITNEGLGLLRGSYHDLEGKTDEIAARASDFVRRNKVLGLIVTGGFVTLFNPGLEAKVAEAVQIPVASAVSSVTVALRALSVTRAMLITPFTADMNAHIEKHLTSLGFTVIPGPPYDKTRKPGAGVEISPDDLFQRVEASYRQHPTTQAIYFQGATLDPLPIIQRLEDNLGIPVVSSNTAMIWNILSKLGSRFSIKGYGKLLSSWPAAA
jgi:maleate cis-trans isomerase